MKVFVTGGCGWLGSWISNALLKEGHEITIYDLVSAPKPEWPSIDGATVIVGNILNKEELLEAMKGMEVVVHVAAIVMVGISAGRDWNKFQTVNIDGTRVVLDVAKSIGVKGFVFTSSMSVLYSGSKALVDVTEEQPYPKSWACHYAKSKALSEQMALNETQFPVVCLRPSFILGPYANSWHDIYLNGDPMISAGPGGPLIDWVEIRSVVFAHVLAVKQITKEGSIIVGKAYNLGAGEPMEHRDLYLKICKACETPPGKLLNPTIASIGLTLAHIPYQLFGALPLMTGPAFVRYTQHELTFDSSAAKKDLGWSPVITMDEAIEEFASAVKADRGRKMKG